MLQLESDILSKWPLSLEYCMGLTLIPEAATRGVLWKKVFLKISRNSQENTCTRASFLLKLQACNFIKRETLAQVLSLEIFILLNSWILYNLDNRCNTCRVSNNYKASPDLRIRCVIKNSILIMKSTSQ